MSGVDPHIVIVGAGFCGTMVAVHLLRQLPAGRLTLVNRPGPADRKTLARGLAYGTASARHVLNVPAGRMSAFDDAPDDFLRFLHAQGADAGGGSFVPRHRYGAYLDDTLRRAASSAHAVSFDVVTGEVRELIATAEGQRLSLADGRHLDASRVVLALGHFAPSQPACIDAAVAAAADYVRDPWQVERIDRLPLDLPVLLIGTGLTMYDIALSLAQRAGERGLRPDLMAVSRRGLLPRAHREETIAPTFAHAPAGLLESSPRVRGYLRRLRDEADRLAVQGVDWREIMAGIRPLTPPLWRRLPIDERARFLRHLRPWWDVHRHRAAPEIAAAIDTLVDTGALTVRAARLTRIRTGDAGRGFLATLAPRGGSATCDLAFGAIVNCTGPSSDIRDEPLLRELSRAGRLVADPFRLGIDVAEDYRPLDARGLPAKDLFYVGPLLKARDWEAIAVPELRVHAARCADAVCRSL